MEKMYRLKKLTKTEFLNIVFQCCPELDKKAMQNFSMTDGSIDRAPMKFHTLVHRRYHAPSSYTYFLDFYGNVSGTIQASMFCGRLSMHVKYTNFQTDEKCDKRVNVPFEYLRDNSYLIEVIDEPSADEDEECDMEM